MNLRNIATLNSIRYFSCLYFHGHSVGGTNPSLLEAMASHALICAHDNEFNAAILGPDAYYFKNSSDIAKIITAVNKSEEVNKAKISNNIKKSNLAIRGASSHNSILIILTSSTQGTKC